MIRHLVLIRSENPALLDEGLADFGKLSDEIEGLEHTAFAHDTSGRSQGYDRLLSFDFVDESALKSWTDHSAHAPIKKAVGAAGGDIITFDYEF